MADLLGQRKRWWKSPEPYIKTFALPNAGKKRSKICFANASLSLSPPPRLTTGTVERRASLLVLLTGILCVDECAGLTAQCAYLIGAALLSR